MRASMLILPLLLATIIGWLAFRELGWHTISAFIVGIVAFVGMYEVMRLMFSR